MTAHILLPQADRTLKPYIVGQHEPIPAASRAIRSRVAYSAVHVVADPLAGVSPWTDAFIDWDATLAYRRYIWSLGLGVAEGMDTAQRGMGLDWPHSRELISRTLNDARSCNGLVACGVGTDQLDQSPSTTVEDVITAYEEQLEFIEDLGGRAIVMASRVLAASAQSADDYCRVYDRILSQSRMPVILHWLGEMFDPALQGYWGSRKPREAAAIVLSIIRDHADKVDGIKISLLDDELEIAMRRALPNGVRMYTGDDYNFPDLIRGDDQGYSDALLGVFDAIAPAASAALGALDEGDGELFTQILAPTLPLSRHIFEPPTRFYKTGVVFLAWLNGHQNHFRMLGGQESARSTIHLSRLFELADKAGVLMDSELAAQRMSTYLTLSGVC